MIICILYNCVSVKLRKINPFFHEKKRSPKLLTRLPNNFVLSSLRLCSMFFEPWVLVYFHFSPWQQVLDRWGPLSSKKQRPWLVEPARMEQIVRNLKWVPIVASSGWGIEFEKKILFVNFTYFFSKFKFFTFKYFLLIWKIFKINKDFQKNLF